MVYLFDRIAGGAYRWPMHCYNTVDAMWLVGGVALLAIVTGIVGAILAHKAGMTR